MRTDIEKQAHNYGWFSLCVVLALVIKGGASSSGGILCKIEAKCSPSECDSESPSVKPGSNVTLNCSVIRGGPVQSIVWQWKSNSWSSSVLLQNINATRGSQEFKCLCADGNSDDERSITLNILSKPQLRSKSSKQIKLKKGREETLVCSFSGWPIPRIDWLKGNEPIENGTGGFYVSEERLRGDELNSILRFYPAGHFVEYTCNATNSIGSDSFSIEALTVCPTRSVSVQSSFVRARKSSNITLDCRIRIDNICLRSDISLIWHLKRKILKTSRWVKKVDVEGGCKRNFTLNILNVTEEDKGEYSCEMNCGGTLSKTATIDLEVYLETPENETTSPTLVNVPTGTNNIWMLPVAILLSLGGVIVLVIIAIVFKNKWRGKKEKYNVDGVVADSLFISYSSRDFGWVTNNLIPLLEKNSITYTIHSRDFELGRPIVQNMADSVYGSRKVLIVLSDNYLVSSFCRAELDMAMHRELGTRHSSLILVVVDKLKKRQLPGVLRNMNPLDYSKLEEKKHWEEKIIGKILNEKTVSSV